jgi:hypothetical protein
MEVRRCCSRTGFLIVRVMVSGMGQYRGKAKDILCTRKQEKALAIARIEGEATLEKWYTVQLGRWWELNLWIYLQLLIGCIQGGERGRNRHVSTQR